MVKLKAVAGVLSATAWIALAIVASGATPALASTLVVAPAGDTSCGQHTPYHTIQSAVDAAAPGAHIFVCPALYQEHVVISGSGKNNLNLEGASTNNTFIQFPVTPSSPDAIVLIDGATNVEVHHFTIEGPWNDANALGCAQPTHYGVFVQGGGSARIDNNHITFIQDADPLLGGCQDGLAVRIGSRFLGEMGSGTVENNLIDNYQKNGVTIDGPGTTALVQNNTIIGDSVHPNGINPIIARNGVQFGRGATGQVQNNQISNNEYGGGGPPPAAEDPDDNDGTGILAFELTDGLRINNNVLVRNDIGLDFFTATHLLISNNIATNNRFNGFRAEADTSQNTLNNNQASGTPPASGHDCRDDSVDGGTAGTANTWTNDQGQTSQPPGICKPR